MEEEGKMQVEDEEEKDSREKEEEEVRKEESGLEFEMNFSFNS